MTFFAINVYIDTSEKPPEERKPFNYIWEVFFEVKFPWPIAILIFSALHWLMESQLQTPFCVFTKVIFN